MTDTRNAAIHDGASLLDFAVLQSQSQIAAAHCELLERRLVDPLPSVSLVRRAVRRILRRPDPALVLKTWDVQRALEAIAARIDPSEAILDVGAYACDILPALKRLGYSNLYGIDLDPAVLGMPYADSINYTVGDLMSTPWSDGHFACITAISVIEHGVEDRALCQEVSRVLRPGGIFIFTTDYWPQKIATTERMFGLDWRIFDSADIDALVDVARGFNLRPVAAPGKAIHEVAAPSIHFADKDYTFLYGAFIRDDD